MIPGARRSFVDLYGGPLENPSQFALAQIFVKWCSATLASASETLDKHLNRNTNDAKDGDPGDQMTFQLFLVFPLQGQSRYRPILKSLQLSYGTILPEETP